MAKKKTPAEYEREKTDLHTAYIRCFKSGEGAVVLADLRAQFHNKTTVMYRADGGGIDLASMALNEGARKAYLYIEAMVAEAEYARSGRNDERVDVGVDVFDGPDERDESSIN